MEEDVGVNADFVQTKRIAVASMEPVQKVPGYRGEMCKESEIVVKLLHFFYVTAFSVLMFLYLFNYRFNF